jgi:putative membrane protein
VVGAVYGAAAEIIPMVSRGFGLPFGAAVRLGAHVVAVPALGLTESPVRRPVAEEAKEFGLHLVYGSVTELVRRLLRA